MMWQPAPIVFPDVELWATQHLRAALAARTESYAAGVFVGTKVPSQASPRMILVRRDGGTATGLLDAARLSLRVWAEKGKDQEATDLARLALALLWGAPTGDPVAFVTHDSGPVPVVDETGRPVRYAVVTAHMVGQQLGEAP